MIGIDKLSYQSRWRDKDPRAKFALYLLSMTLAMVLSPFWQAMSVLGFAMFTSYLLRISVLRYLKWLLIPLGFLTFGLVAIVLSASTQPDSLLWGFPIGKYWVGLDPQGIQIANQTFWRSLAALSATLWFMMNMPFEQMIKLLKFCRVPHLLIEQILLTWRFIFIFFEEAVAIHHAQSLRFGYRSLRTSYYSLAMLVSMLFSRVMSRYQQMSVALELKLYQGDFHL
ncbi:energy-coupling factor ABC transporter transmembrane protein [Xenorhabdus nematophila]|uniref:energy-coupling factor ABC transporter transmembrane protein n=1 Tax=Xenorhabdus nematophila TaxID=628 RepID=UPI00054454F6|nr:energy-coupling factor ABC transporter transmembrane protein [Xenorhabdus nematophila]CEE93997.1 Cobalt transport protein cbiQ [Xenorhabdus nematophila str. Anatoliense]CEF30754.1 Cobalt transport protein cbiQ [Xenorhabdus nematophila str. Websteri]AYA40811.1 energy-coupling factor ABC transporter transmembrane protein [Xenorhabdus nematophila]KHD28631.1 cobalamin biosynthesis protein CbiQ [Xenorhabdus nematophila]MBA0019560.1 energy-coupling factor ABC transporter transmembrane protein [Xe